VKVCVKRLWDIFFVFDNIRELQSWFCYTYTMTALLSSTPAASERARSCLQRDVAF